MQYRFFNSIIGATALLFLLAAPMASTQESESRENGTTDETEEMDEIIVTEQHLYSNQVNSLRSPTPIIDVPQSLSILSSEQIALQGLTSVSDIINYTPGVNTSQGEGHRDAVVFRGVRSTADFYVDGARDDVQYFRPLYNLEQVEILRGPNALMFGRGGTGGILNRVTKKGVVGEQFTDYTIGAGTFGDLGFAIDSNLAINDRTAFRINAAYESLENHRDSFDGDRFGVNPTARFQLSPSTILDVSYEYIDHERFIDRGIVSGDDGRPVEAFEDIIFADPDLSTTELDAHVIRAAVQHKFSDNLKGNFSAFYGDYDKLYQNIFPSDFDQTTNVVELDGYVDTTERENFVLSANFIGEFGTGGINHTVVTGVEYIDTSSDQDRFNAQFDTSMDDMETFVVNRPVALNGGVGVNAAGDITTISFSQLNDDTEVDIDVISLFLQDEIEIMRNLDLVLGLRYDEFEIDVFNVEALIDGEPDDVINRSRTDQQVSPRAGLIYKPRENISIYASYSESFLPRSGEQFADINGDDNVLDPNESTNLEAGVKWDPNPSLSFTASVFEIENSSPQVADADPDTLDIIDEEITGLEVQLQGQINDAWLLTAGYSYLTGDDVDEFGNDTGLRPRELPKNTFSVWNSFQATSQFGIGIGLTYQDESFADNGNTVTLPSFTRLDLSAHFDVNEKLRVQLNIENFTDQLYFPNAHTTNNITVGESINARLSVTGRF